MEVWCGMIMGFDHDNEGIFDRQVQFIQDSRIAFAMSGMLSAIPKTPLHDRLAAEGRLDRADTCEYGTNVIPLLMTREELRDGYIRVMNELYDPEAYFERAECPVPRAVVRLGITSGFATGSPGPAVTARGAHDVPGDRPVRPADDPRRRRASPPRVPQATLAIPQGPPAPGLVLRYLFHMAMHYHAYQLAKRVANPETAIDQLLLRIRGFEGSTVERQSRDRGSSSNDSGRGPAAVPGAAYPEPNGVPTPAPAPTRSQREKYGGLFYLGIAGLVLLMAPDRLVRLRRLEQSGHLGGRLRAV